MNFLKNNLNFYLTFFIYGLISESKIAYCDLPINWQINFQAPATPYMEGIINFHNILLFFIIIIVFFVSFLLFKCLFFFNSSFYNFYISIFKNFFKFFESLNSKEIFYKTKINFIKKLLLHLNFESLKNNFTHSINLEIIWTILPAIILIIIAIPSFSLLYALDENINAEITLKVTGRQWYWHYDVVDIENNRITSNDSYILDLESEPNLRSIKFSETEEPIYWYSNTRLLDVDVRPTIPCKTNVRILVTSDDVLHSWAIPSLGVKVDACPGRINQIYLFVKRGGFYYGQCSEICGVNHGFMPISIVAC
jgi:heme/copper-type cytochrome/quinol oxidase subunit 2